MAWLELIMTATYTIQSGQARPIVSAISHLGWSAIGFGSGAMFLAWLSPQDFGVWTGAILAAISAAVGVGLKLWDQIDKRIVKREQRHDRRSGSHRKAKPEREV